MFYGIFISLLKIAQFPVAAFQPGQGLGREGIFSCDEVSSRGFIVLCCEEGLTPEQMPPGTVLALTAFQKGISRLASHKSGFCPEQQFLVCRGQQRGKNGYQYFA